MAAAAKLTKSYLHVPRKVPFNCRTIGQQLYHVADKYSNKEMYVFCEDNERITFKHMKDRSRQFAASLLSKGLKKGDRMALLGFNHSEWVIAFFACAQLGILPVALRLEFPVNTLSTLLKKLKCKAILLTRSPATLMETMYQLIPELQDGAKDQLFARIPRDTILSATYAPYLIFSKLCIAFDSFPDLQMIIYGDQLQFGDTKNRSIYSVSSFLEIADDSNLARVADICASIDMDHPAIVYFTSRTTGIPKPTILSNHTMVNDIGYGWHKRHGVQEPGLEENWESTRFAITQNFAGSGSYSGTYLPLETGCTSVVLYTEFTVEAMANALTKERITDGLFFIHHMALLVNYAERNKCTFPDLNLACVAGSNVPEKLRQKINQIPKHRRNMYGMTECLIVLLNYATDPQDVLDEDKLYPVGGSEMKIVNDKGQVVPVNVQGELLIRCFSTLLYYLDEPEKTRELKDDNGWLHTGDVAKMDQRGFIQICGRIKDLIIKNAVNLSPLELERVLNQHETIADSMVVGVPDDIAGEEVCACVRLKSESSVTHDEIIAYCIGKVNTLLVPKYVVFVDEFATTALGKFSRKMMTTRAVDMLNLKQEM